MSNTVEHDEFSSKMEAAFVAATKYFKEIKGLTEEELKVQEVEIGKDGISLCENSLLHTNINDPSSYTLIKDVDSRQFKIMKHDEKYGPDLIAIANMSDDPSIEVYVGKNSLERINAMSAVEDVTNAIKHKHSLAQKLKAPKPEVKKNKRPNARINSRPSSRR